MNITDTKYEDLWNLRRSWEFMEQMLLWIGMYASETVYALMFVPCRFMIWLTHQGIRFLIGKLTQPAKKIVYNV